MSPLSWVRSFNDIVRTSEMPELSGQELILATDISGTHRQNPFEVLGVVLFDWDASMRWERLRQVIRREILKDSRRMAFKKLDEAVRQRALIPFLKAADEMEGVCLCVGVNKMINSLGFGNVGFAALKTSGILKGSWSPASFERMARTTHFIALLIAGLCSEGQNITWISDEDEMFESPLKSEDTLRILTLFNRMYVKWPLGKLQAGTTKLDEGDRFEEDFTAVADLAAGAFAELIMKLKGTSEDCIVESFWDDLSSQVSGKSKLLLAWLGDTSQKLKRVSVIFDRRPDGKFKVAKL